MKRSSVSASGKAAMPITVTEATPKSLAKVPICEMTIRPEVDIMVIIANISQKSGVRSICFGVAPFTAAAVFFTKDALQPAGGRLSTSAAATPTMAIPRPKRCSVWW